MSYIDQLHILTDAEEMRTKFPLRTSEGSEDRFIEEDFPRNEFQLSRRKPLIRIARPTDAPAIEALAKSVSLENVPEPSKTGFLVSGFTKTAYKQFVNKAENFFVLHQGGELVGSLLAYGSERIDPEKEEVNMHIKQNICCTGKFVLIKQICVSPKMQHRQKGYASLLYKELYARITHYYNHEAAARPLYTAIVKEPDNPVSRKFHKKLGFLQNKEEELYTPRDGKPRLIFENLLSMEFLDKLTTEETRSEKCPFYDSRAMMDPHCIDIGVTLYSIGPPDVLGNFECNVRIVMKWRQLKIEAKYPMTDDGLTRRDIDLKNTKKKTQGH